MKTRAQLARSRESLYSTMLPLKEMARKEVQFGEGSNFSLLEAPTINTARAAEVEPPQTWLKVQ